MKNNYDFQFKILLVGDSSVGKTSILLKFTDGTFSDSHMTTIGMEARTKFLIHKNYKINLNILDSAGQERFKSITKNYFKGANGIMFVYDVTNIKSYHNLKDWVRQAEGMANLKFKKILIGNKIDLKDNIMVDKTLAEKFSEEKGCKFLETSAKTDQNINEAFLCLIEELLNEKFENKGKEVEEVSPGEKLKANKDNKKENKKKSFC